MLTEINAALHQKREEVAATQRRALRPRSILGPNVVHRRSKMVVAGILSVLTVAGLGLILTAWKTGLVE